MEKLRKQSTLARLKGELLISVARFLFWFVQLISRFIHSRHGNVATSGAGAGHTVLVTTGRQVKTLHTIRALREIGARVIVSDYDPISTSAVSSACDTFERLPALDAEKLEDWVNALETIIVKHGVDTVLPISTINEVLFMGVARDRLQPKYPNVRWMCPTLEQAICLDDRAAFSSVCDTFGVRVPVSGVATSRSDIPLGEFKTGIVVKRIESTVNRDEEVICLDHGESLPDHVAPSQKNPWQWQQRIIGQELSAWYACENGRVTFSACYLSGPSMVHFDAADGVPKKLDAELRRLISGMRLSGQYAFDFMVDGKRDAFVFECNPRASSILCTVSQTPLWAECFFGKEVPESRVVRKNVGFLVHQTSWPFAPSRSEAVLSLRDPFPFLITEVVWPLWAIGSKGCTSAGWNYIDCNIGKIIIDGPSPARGLETFKSVLFDEKMVMLRKALQFVDCVFVDVCGPFGERMFSACSSAASSCRVVPFLLKGTASEFVIAADFIEVESVSELVDKYHTDSTQLSRVLLSAQNAQNHGFGTDVALLIPRKEVSVSKYLQVPLKKICVLHVMGSCVSQFYENLSSMYGYQCIDSITDSVRFEHVVAYVHPGGLWSVERGLSLDSILGRAERLSSASAIAKIDSYGVDVMLPHMFDYAGLTAYRSLFDVLGIPFIGCSGEALALSTNKVRTKACAEQAGVPVPKSELLRAGQSPSISPPFIIKPSEEDNSQGVCLIKDKSEMQSALDAALQFGGEVMCEEFVPLGRELRTAVIEREDGSLHMLPLVEYYLPQESPIRLPADKLMTDSDGIPQVQTKCERACPAYADDTLRGKLEAASTVAHVALGCRDYSIYDFRVDPSGEPFMLESSLYCSFAPLSAIVLMGKAEGIPHPKLFVQFCERAIARQQQLLRAPKGQKFGMKLR